MARRGAQARAIERISVTLCSFLICLHNIDRQQSLHHAGRRRQTDRHPFSDTVGRRRGLRCSAVLSFLCTIFRPVNVWSRCLSDQCLATNNPHDPILYYTVIFAHIDLFINLAISFLPSHKHVYYATMPAITVLNLMRMYLILEYDKTEQEIGKPA